MTNPLLDLHDAVHGLIEAGYDYEFSMREFERMFIVATLRLSKGNKCRAAARMGMHRNTIRRKLDQLGRAPIATGLEVANEQRLDIR